MAQSSVQGTWSGKVFTAPGGVRLKMTTAVKGRVSASLRADGWVETVLPGTSTVFAEQPVGSAKSANYKEFTFPDGYTYRQLANGDILIVASPHGGAGTTVSETGAQSKAWQAINAQIAAKKSGNVKAVADTSLAVLRILNATLTPRQKRRHAMPEFVAPPPPPPATPWGWIAAGVAGVAVVLTLGRSR